MLNKEKILDILNYYSLPKDEFIIISGASMVLQEIKKETSDIDIAVSENLYNYLINNYKCKLEKISENGAKVWFINKINFSTNYYKSVDYIYFDEFKIQSIESILKLKKELNRKKDLNDISLLERI